MCRIETEKAITILMKKIGYQWCAECDEWKYDYEFHKNQFHK